MGEAPSLPALKPRWAVVLATLAVAIRLIYLADASDYPAFAVPIVDSLNYDANARVLASGGEVGIEFFSQPPFYPWFLSIVYRLSDGSIIAAKVVQALVGALTCMLALWLGRRLFDARTGIVAFAITAIYGPLIFYETELLATGWAAFWAAALVSLCVAVRERAAPWRCLLTGAVAALSVLTRPTFTPFVAAAALWLSWCWLRQRSPAERTAHLRNAALMLVGFAVIAAPVALKAHSVTGRFSILPASGGINTFIGNHPDMARMLTIPVGEEWRQLADQPRREGIEGPWEQQSYFYDRTLEFVRDDPASAAGRLVQKAARLISSREIPRNVDVYVARHWSALLSALVWKIWQFGFPFGVLLPLALVGLWSLRRQLPVAPTLFLVLYGGSIVAVFVTARYRIPLVPVLAVFAGAGGVALHRMATARDRRGLTVAGLLMVAAALLATIPGPFAEEEQRFDAGLYANVAYYHLRQNDKARAHQLYSHALELDPTLAEAHLNVGNLLAEQRRLDEAEHHYRIARDAKPQLAAIHTSYGSLLLQRGRVDDAITSFRAGVDADPTLAQAHMNLAVALQRTGRTDDAIAEYREAVRLGPGNPLAHYNLGVALGGRGDHRGAVTAYREAVRLAPAAPRFRYGLAFGLEQAGQPQAAVREYEAVLRAAPGYSDTRQRLERLRGR